MRATGRITERRLVGGLNLNFLWVYFIFFIGFILTAINFGQVPDRNLGLKYYRNYSPEEYGLDPQNWGLIQDLRGILYMANNGGILEYDGNSWDFIKIPNQTVLSIAVDANGIVYVGGIDELGFLAANSQGEWEYKSLMKYMPREVEQFGNVWRCHATGEGIFFRTSKYFFQWQPQQKQMRILLESVKGESDRINGSFDSGGRLWIKQLGHGLMQFKYCGLDKQDHYSFQFISTFFCSSPEKLINSY